jgi:RHS repeat-associated protein
MPGRNYQSSTAYRYGMNGQEKDDEIASGIYTAEYWEYDSRLGRRWNVDPVRKPWISPYICFSDNPIIFVDPNGDDDYFDYQGKYLGSDNQKSKNIQFIKREDVGGLSKKGETFVVSDSKTIAQLASKSTSMDKVVFKLGPKGKDGYTGTGASNQVISNVINHYFKGENDKYEVIYDPTSNAMATTDENKTIEIQLNNKGQLKSSLLANANNLQVAVGHEKFHKANHGNIDYYSFNGNVLELDALYSETENPLYNSTTNSYKENLKSVVNNIIGEAQAYINSNKNLGYKKEADKQQKKLDGYKQKFEKKLGK